MKRSLSFKLIVAFAVVAVITLVVGVVGFLASKKISVFGDEALPVVRSLENLLVSQHAIKAAARTLLSPNITDEDYQRQFDLIQNHRAQQATIVAWYDDLEKPDEEIVLYNRYKELREIQIKETDMYLSEVRSLREENISNEVYAERVSAMALSGSLRAAYDNSQDAIVAHLAWVDLYYDAFIDESIRFSNAAIIFIAVIVIVGFVASIALGLFLARSITRPIVRIIDALSSGAHQITNSSNELAAVSEQIASGANEQAAGIEEVSSSMEELGSIVAHNVENTRASSDISMQAVEQTNIGVEEMNQMVIAMDEIARATDEIKTVIDVIDDIAFQTNMLALNAAVEAARAGEAGLGFAVVADEVKNLANRSAESAKDTTAIIKLSLEKTEDGSRRAKKLAELFTGINTGGKKAFDMAKEVEAASKQQEEGINQINTAIMQLDQVVQQNAAASEEAASSAEELQSQVLLTEEIVEELTELVLGVQKRVQEEEREEAAIQKAKPKEGSEKKYIEHI